MAGRVTALLGPTNTGKTHYALDRMLGHETGMIGFPLRLLARENYDRIVKAKGAAQVALITGEEKIIPPRPRWYVCTVESMPLDRRVAFLAVDEIQLCADPDRGHIFTDRLLHARGTQETVFLGAETIKPLIRKLVGDVEFISRPRLSKLTYSGPKKLNRLPPRSAVVAFSAGDVYAMADFVRRQRGGAAVVLGALSPRTRNAQVALYQAGEVDYIVATDAIGMGLNMAVDHVAFAGLRKFDGRSPRLLDSGEIAQIAGRAGRHMNDGTFGVTADAPEIDAEIVEAVENHSFQPLRALSWRNSDLRFATLDALRGSLERAPDQPGLIRARDADDQLALNILAEDLDIAALANHPERVKLLWDVCRIPDFRKVMADNHTRLLTQIYKHLCGKGRRLPADWLAGHIKRLDRTDGELEVLLSRIAHVRTWTYVAHQPGWTPDAAHWQETARALEDRLSDALHHCLTQRFVDRRTSVLVRAMRDDAALLGAVAKTGEVLVEGQFVGRLSGFRFVADAAEGAAAAKTVLSAAQRSLRPEISARVARLVLAGDADFAFDPTGSVLWEDQPVGRLVKGAESLKPGIEVLSSDLLEPPQRERIRKRLASFVAESVAMVFKPILDDAGLSAPARGLLHVLVEGLGCADARAASDQLRKLSPDDRRALTRRGIRFGMHHVLLPSLLKPAAQSLRLMLHCVWAGKTMPAAPVLGRTCVRAGAMDAEMWRAVGCSLHAGFAIRNDVLERLAAMRRAAARDGADPAGPGRDAMSLLGLSAQDCEAVIKSLDAAEQAPKTRKPHWRKPKKHDESSPFAALRGVFESKR